MGSFCEYLGRCLLQNVENADGTRSRSLWTAKWYLGTAAARDLRVGHTQWGTWSVLGEQTRNQDPGLAMNCRYRQSARV